VQGAGERARETAQGSNGLGTRIKRFRQRPRNSTRIKRLGTQEPRGVLLIGYTALGHGRSLSFHALSIPLLPCPIATIPSRPPKAQPQAPTTTKTHNPAKPHNHQNLT
jgi:hypothetical protein